MIERIKDCIRDNLDGMDCIDCGNFRKEIESCDLVLSCRWRPSDAVVDKLADEIRKTIEEKRFLVGFETGRFYDEEFCISIFHESEKEMQKTVEYLKARKENENMQGLRAQDDHTELP